MSDNRQWYIVHDIRWCQDCNDCTMACKDEHVFNDWPGYTKPQPRHGHRWNNLLRRERGRYARNDYRFLNLMCQHCENCPIVEKGFATRREDGIVLIDMEKAKGHEEIVEMCPYGTVYYNYDEDMPQKCTFCAHLLDDPDWNYPDGREGVMRCVHSCPDEALHAYHITPMEMDVMIKEQGLEQYKPETGMKTHVYYKNLGMFTKNFIWGGVTKDGDCYENATATLYKGKELVGSVKTNFFGDYKFDCLEDGDYMLKLEVAGDVKEIEVKIEGKSLNLDYTAF